MPVASLPRTWRRDELAAGIRLYWDENLIPKIAVQMRNLVEYS